MLDPIKFDPLSAEFAADPYPFYAALRAMDGPYYYADIDTWMLTKMVDVDAVAVNRSMVRNNEDSLSDAERREQQRKMNWHDMPYHERFVQVNMLDSDGEMHDRLRALVSREFLRLGPVT